MSEIKEEQTDPTKIKEDLTDVESLKKEAENEYEKFVVDFQKRNAKELHWKSILAKNGNLSDKIASLTVLIQENPIHNLNSLIRLVSMIKVGKRLECTLALDNLPELFSETLLKPDSKLLKFEDQTLSDLCNYNVEKRRSSLINWYFEDKVKDIFENFVKYLKNLSHDSLEINRKKMIRAVFHLLMNTCEQQKELLECIVNKIGDLSKEIVSKILYYFKHLIQRKPRLKIHILNEIEKLLFRQNIDKRCQYYAICVLVSFHLKKTDINISSKLIDIYFAFFKACIKSGDIDTKLLEILLNGVNNAYKINQIQTEKISEHINTLYKLVHLARFNISLSTINLLFQTLNQSESNDRFYGALYRVMLRPELVDSSHQFLFLSVILRSLKNDKEINRIRAFLKRLLQIALGSNATFCSGILFVVSQLVSDNKDLLMIEFKNISNKNQSENNVEDDEHYNDDDDNDVNNSKKENNLATVGWIHRNTKSDERCKYYDSFYRNPRYAGAQFSIFDELLLLRNHYHPTVALFAETVLNGEKIDYNGDPLRDFTLIRFLDKFAFKNPKKNLPNHQTVKENADFVPLHERFLDTYFKTKKDENHKMNKSDYNDIDNDSVASEEFDEVITKMMGLNPDDFDFSEEIKKSSSSKGSKKKRKHSVEDEEEEDRDNINQKKFKKRKSKLN